MALFNNFPWTNFHELNLDWLLRKVAEMEQAFPEGTIGIPKGGTGATTAEGARQNLGVYGINIPLSALDSTTLDEAIQGVAEDVDDLQTALANALNYKLFKSVESVGQIPGTATIGNVWTAMSTGEILLAPPDQFYPGECPETYGTLILIRSGGTSGYCLFAGADHMYKKTFSGNVPMAGWQQVFTDSDIIPIANGGTGADNAADAVTNLGIDFSGEVLSVAGVGANAQGDVPLTLSDLTITSVSEINLTPGSVTAIQAFNAMPVGSEAFIPYSDISDPPVSGGVVHLYKQGAGAGYVELFDSGKLYVLDLTGNDWKDLTPSTTGTIAAIRTVTATIPAGTGNRAYSTTDINPTGAIAPINLASWSSHPDMTPVGVMGHHTSGTGATQISFASIRISGNQLGFAGRAMADTQAITCTFWVLYMKTSI